MKSTHEPFDKELRGRLLDYKEEADKDLWPGIAARIVSVNPAPVWVVWSNRLSIVVIVLSTALFLNENDARHSELVAMRQSDPVVEDIGNVSDPISPHAQETTVAKEILSGKTGISFIQPGHAANQERQVSGLAVEMMAEEKVAMKWNEPIVDWTRVILKGGDDVMRSEKSSAVISNADNSHMADQGVVVIPPSTFKIRKLIGSDVKKVLVVTDSTKSTELTESKNKDRKRKPFTLYFTAMPTFGYQRIEPNIDDPLWIESIKRVPAFSADRLGVRIEAGAEIPLSKRWKAFAGVLYYQRKQTIEYTADPGKGKSISVEPQNGVGMGARPIYVEKSIEYELRNAGVQVGLMYQLWMGNQNSITEKEGLSSETIPAAERKFLHLLGTGLEFHKAVNRTHAWERVEAFSDPSTYVFFNLYYRLQYPHTGRLRAIFQPTLNYSFYINEDLNAPFYVKPYGLGLNFGCTYNFR